MEVFPLEGKLDDGEIPSWKSLSSLSLLDISSDYEYFIFFSPVHASTALFSNPKSNIYAEIDAERTRIGTIRDLEDRRFDRIFAKKKNWVEKKNIVLDKLKFKLRENLLRFSI